MQEVHDSVQAIAAKDDASDFALLKSVLQSLSVAAFVIRPPPGEIAWCNAAVEKVFGDAPAELIGQSMRVLHIDDAHFERFHARVQAVVGAGETFRGRYWMRRKDASAFPSEHLVTPVLTVAGHVATVSFIQDAYGEGAAKLREHLALLSPRQRDVFDATVKGHSAKETAQLLGVSNRTVEAHRARILEVFEYDTVQHLMAELLAAKSAFRL